MEKVRVDKWLWSVRIFKSRTLAADACKAGKVKIGESVAKASDMVAVGNHLYVKKKRDYEMIIKSAMKKIVIWENKYYHPIAA